MLAVLLLCLLGSGVGSGSFQTASIDDIPTPLELTIQQLLPVLGSEAMDTIVGIAKGMPSPTNADPCQNLGRGSSALQSELSASTPLSNLLAGGAVAVHVGLPAEMLRLESTQDAMSTLSWHLFDSTSVRMAWGLQPMDTLERSKQRQSVMESQAVSEGAMLLAQLSFLKCVRSAAAPTIFSPLALRIGATADSEVCLQSFFHFIPFQPLPVSILSRSLQSHARLGWPGELKTQRSTCALSCGDGGCGGSEIFCRGWLVLEHRCIHRKLEDGEAQGALSSPSARCCHPCSTPFRIRMSRSCDVACFNES